MNGSDQKTFLDRLEKLEKLIIEEFASKQFKVELKPVISVSLVKQSKIKERNHKIAFSTDEEFLTDLDSDVEKIFQQGVNRAKEILDDPPMKDRILQGEIQLTHNGAIFNKRKI